MAVNLPIQNYFNSVVGIDSWVRPSDWVVIDDAPNAVQFLMSDIDDASCTIRTSFTQLSGSQYITIDWGDGTTSTVSTTTSTDTTHQYTIGTGTPCSLGYTTFRIRVFLEGVGVSTIDNCNIFAKLISGNTQNPYQLCGVLEAYYGDNTQTTIPINFYSGSNAITSLSSFNYLSYVKCPSVVTWVNCDNIFRNCQSISKIVMPTIANSITSLQTAFNNCQSLVDLEFMTEASNIFSLNNTFNSCFNLKKIILPNALDNLTDLTFAFASCFRLSNITFPSINLATTFVSTFANCYNLAWVKFTSLPTIPSSTTTITFPNTFFTNCWNLQTIYFPTSVGNINSKFTFSCFGTNTPSLKTLKFPTNMDFNTITLSSTANLVSCVLPQTPLTAINLSSIFSGCLSLVSVVLPATINGLANLNGTFSNCNKLEEVTIPNSYQISNMSSTFANCFALKQVNWNPTTQNSLLTIANIFQNCRSLRSVNLPTSMSLLSSMANAFSNCTLIDNIVLPSTLDGVSTMQSAFGNCYNLKTISLPTSMGTCSNFFSTFSGCNSLKSITLPNVVFIGVNSFSSTFALCTSLNLVTLPGSQQLINVTTIGQIFLGCSSLTTINNFDKIGDPANSITIDASAITNARLTSISFVGKYSVLSLAGTTTALADVQSVRLLNTNTGQWGGSSPQINVSYTNMSTANLIQLFNDMAAQGSVVSKTINITSATGAAGLSAGDRLIITSLGWTIIG